MSDLAELLYRDFAAWADTILAQPIPAEVVAFSVNLYEGAETFDVQITGSPTFDPADQIWACEIAFSSGENLFPIPRQRVSDRWEQALDLVRELVKRYLSAGSGASVLRASKGVGVGFVEGDLHLVWPEAAA
jgi:hypothetical protein